MASSLASLDAADIFPADLPYASLALGVPPSGILLSAGSHNLLDMFGSAEKLRVDVDEDLGGPRVNLSDKEAYAINLGRAARKLSAPDEKNELRRLALRQRQKGAMVCAAIAQGKEGVAIHSWLAFSSSCQGLRNPQMDLATATPMRRT